MDYKSIIVNKLSWNDMPGIIVQDAISIMVNNLIGCVADCTGDVLSEEEALKAISERECGDRIWLDLFIHDFYSLNNEEMRRAAAFVRGGIESLMRCSMKFKDAAMDLYYHMQVLDNCSNVLDYPVEGPK